MVVIPSMVIGAENEGIRFVAFPLVQPQRQPTHANILSLLSSATTDTSEVCGTMLERYIADLPSLYSEIYGADMLRLYMHVSSSCFHLPFLPRTIEGD